MNILRVWISWTFGVIDGKFSDSMITLITDKNISETVEH